MEVWGLDTERRPIETHQVRPWGPPAHQDPPGKALGATAPTFLRFH